MLCKICQNAIGAALIKASSKPRESSPSYYVLHDSYGEFVDSVQEGCFVCRHIWTSTFNDQTFNAPRTQLVASLSKEIPDGLIRFSLNNPSNPNRMSVRLRDRSDTMDFLFLPSTFQDPQSTVFSDNSTQITSASTSMNPELWYHWFHTCAVSHAKCREIEQQLAPYAVQRLVKILVDDKGFTSKWRLVAHADVGAVPYVTLSHCWGSSQHIRLMKDNYLSFVKKNSSTMLPKMYQDAFAIAASLGFDYIWIDSLCIIQDDASDWEAQSSVMGSIYKNSRCNIAATWAKDGSQGCFSTRDVALLNTPLVRLPHHRSDSSPLRRITDSMSYYRDIIDASLNTRGWVVQERYLSRKQLSFSKQQVYWECDELIASEQFPLGVPSQMTDFSDHNQTPPPAKGKPRLVGGGKESDGETHRRSWTALVEIYSNCKLTRSSDKMVAIAGLAAEQRIATGDSYLAGLWKSDLLHQLCWTTDFDERCQQNRLRIVPFIAPTWSWASVTGPILADMRYGGSEEESEQISCAEVLTVSVESQDPFQLHSFISSKLRLRGISLWAFATFIGDSCNLSDNTTYELKVNRVTRVGDGLPLFPTTKRFEVAIHWDENLESPDVEPSQWRRLQEERRSNLFFMFAALDSSLDIATGLVARKLSDNILLPTLRFLH